MLHLFAAIRRLQRYSDMKISTLANVVLAMDDKYVVDVLSAEISREMGRPMQVHGDIPRLLRSLIENRTDPNNCSAWLCLWGIDVKIDLSSEVNERFSMITSDDDRIKGLPSVVQIVSFKATVERARKIAKVSGYTHNAYCYLALSLDNCQPISATNLDEWLDQPCVAYILMTERKADIARYLQT